MANTSAVTDPKFNPSGIKQVDEIKNAAVDFEAIIRKNTPVTRRQSIALSNLETAVMYAVKAAVVGDE